MTAPTVVLPRIRLRHSHTIGSIFGFGSAPRPEGLKGEMPGCSRPIDVATDGRGRVYWLNRMEMLEPNTYLEAKTRVTVSNHNDEFLMEFAFFGTDDGQLTMPTSIAIDSEDRAFVSDERRHDVQIFDRAGKLLGKFGGFGSEDGKFNRPSGLAIDRNGTVLVVDCLNHRVQRFDPSGKFISTWGRLGRGSGEFNMPWGIAVSSTGEILVADWRNARVQRFSAELDDLPSLEAPGDLTRPAGVDIDSAGYVYVSDHLSNRVIVFAPNGELAQTLVGEATLSPSAERGMEQRPVWLEKRLDLPVALLDHETTFIAPIGIHVDDEGRVLIADSGRHRVQVYIPVE